MWKSMRQIRKDPLAFLQQMRSQFGDIVQFPIPVPPSYFLASAADVRHVLVDNARNYDKRTMQYKSLAILTGDGLLTADAETWRANRRIIQPAFHHQAVASMQAAIRAATLDAVNRWRRVESIDIDAEMMRLALEIVGRTLFNADMSVEAADLSSSTLAALDVVVTRAQQPLSVPLSLPTKSNRILNRALSDLQAAVARLISHRLNNPSNHADMLELLIAAYGLQPGNEIPAAVRDEIVTFIVAGHETVASGLTWAWHLLMTNPEQYATLQAASGEDVEQRSRAIFEETLRLYPPAWLITRRATAADEVGGVEVSAGALVIMSPWIVHHDSRWWTNPADFEPARFLVEDDARRFAYLPFGIGARMCIGKDMALLEGAVVLSEISRRVEFELIGGSPLGVHAGVTLRPDRPIMAKLNWR
jgi:cytochrome P450